MAGSSSTCKSSLVSSSQKGHNLDFIVQKENLSQHHHLLLLLVASLLIPLSLNKPYGYTSQTWLCTHFSQWNTESYWCHSFPRTVLVFPIHGKTKKETLSVLITLCCYFALRAQWKQWWSLRKELKMLGSIWKMPDGQELATISKRTTRNLLWMCIQIKHRCLGSEHFTTCAVAPSLRVSSYTCDPSPSQQKSLQLWPLGG